MSKESFKSYQPSEEEQATTEKERVLSDAELLIKGGEYEIINNKPELKITEEQYDKKHLEMEEEIKEKSIKKLTGLTKNQIQKIGEEIKEKHQGETWEETFNSVPELKEKLELINFERGEKIDKWGKMIFLQSKKIPEIALFGYNYRYPYSPYQTNVSEGPLQIEIPDKRLSSLSSIDRKKIIKSYRDGNKEFYLIDPRFRAEIIGVLDDPIEKENNPYFFNKWQHEGYESKNKLWKKWFESEDGKKWEEWRQKKAEEFKREIIKNCNDNGIKLLITKIGKYGWEEMLGNFDDDNIEINEMNDNIEDIF